MRRIDLHTGWMLRLHGPHVPPGLDHEIPATVPGVVHTDLLAAGLIADPYQGTAELEVQWIAETDAVYRTVFDWTDHRHQRVDLVAEGLDTVARVTLNGTEVGRTRNQHRSYRFNVTPLLRRTGNELVVAFDAPLPAARESEQRIGAKPLVGDALPYNALRKMACNFGWDWGPTLTTSGIWRPIQLQAWSVARIAQVVPRVTLGRADGKGLVEAHVDVERVGHEDQEVWLDLTLTAPDGATVVAHVRQVVHEGTSAVLRALVDQPQLWWPREHGGQPLYRAEVRASCGDQQLDTWSRDLGFRTVELRMEPDDIGTSFEFHVNGQRLWVKGANWIPDDCFPSRVGPDDYARGVRDAVEAGMSMLRVWGGGLYESDVLYDLCDRAGLLVWQDFAFACAMYSEADELWYEVEAEARENVARLAPHPSLVLWNGGNETIEGFHHWGFAERMAPGEAWGRSYFEELLPRVLAEVDPTRAYIPSSPWNPADDCDPRHPDHGPVHSWKVWFSEDYLTYRDAIPRFVAEFGFQAPATWPTLMSAIDDPHPAPDSPGMLAHQKAIDGNLKLERGWAGHLPVPATFDDWYMTTQLGQVRAITCAVAHLRSHAPRTGGYLLWQLNDCWPAVSWAAVDSAGRRKPLWYALRALNTPRLLLLQPRGDQVVLVASNDSDLAWTGSVRVRRLSLDGAVLAEHDLVLDVPPRTNHTASLPRWLTLPADPAGEMLLAQDRTGSAVRAWWYFAEDVDLALPTPVLRTQVERTPSGYAVNVRADTLVKDLALFPDRLDPDAVVDQGLVTLLRGEEHTFHVRTTRELNLAALVLRPVLHSASHLREGSPA